MCERCDSADEIEQYRHRVAILEREARAARATIVQLSEAVRVLELSSKAMGLHLLMRQEAAQA